MNNVFRITRNSLGNVASVDKTDDVSENEWQKIDTFKRYFGITDAEELIKSISGSALEPFVKASVISSLTCVNLPNLFDVKDCNGNVLRYNFQFVEDIIPYVSVSISKFDLDLAIDEDDIVLLNPRELYKYEFVKIPVMEEWDSGMIEGVIDADGDMPYADTWDYNTWVDHDEVEF